MASLTQETATTIIQTLQPIRDLTKNWDIDIAGCLDQYLQDLYLSNETRDQLSTHKFAEAALILHNSSGVYSRKVDYLHSYAYRVQRELAIKNAAKQQRNKRNVGIDKDIERFLNFDPNLEFLLLDDVLPCCETGEKVTLKQTKRRSTSETGRDGTNSQSTRLHSNSATILDLNVQRIGSILKSSQGLHLTLGNCDVDENGMCWLPGSQGFSRKTPQAKTTAPNAVQQSFDNVVDRDDVIMDNGMDDHGGDDDDNGAGYEMGSVQLPSPARKVTFVSDGAVRQRSNAKEPEVEDPWKLLDPHVPEPKRPRPLRVGKTIVLPSCMKRLPSEHGKRKENPIPDYLLRPLLEPMATETSWTTGKRAREQKLPLRGLAYGNEFAYIAKEIAKRKARERRNDRIQNGGRPETEDDSPIDFRGEYDDGENDNDDGGFPFDNDDGPTETNTGIGSVDDLYGNDGDQQNEGDTTVKPPSFEELCREHFRRFAKGAERYAVETKLSERVDQWQNKLRPILEAAESRPAFDIHQYGQAVIHDIEETVAQYEVPKKTVEFSDVTRNCSRYEVCRKFLASLSLVNSGNIRLVDGPGIQFELLNADIERPMETFLAPSEKSRKTE